MQTERNIKVLEQACAALKVFSYDAKLNHHISKKDPQSLKQADAAIDEIDEHLAKIRLTIVHDHGTMQKRLVRSIRATTLYNWSQVI
ncbi:MAG TPA: hypothetical protein ENH57_02125 [Actinobacteria bacterium]|nr:hypothetical protein [Actinomycetota bacterium]